MVARSRADAQVSAADSALQPARADDGPGGDQSALAVELVLQPVAVCVKGAHLDERKLVLGKEQVPVVDAQVAGQRALAQASRLVEVHVPAAGRSGERVPASQLGTIPRPAGHAAWQGRVLAQELARGREVFRRHVAR
jgi:hypothetical protein